MKPSLLFRTLWLAKGTLSTPVSNSNKTVLDGRADDCTHYDIQAGDTCSAIGEANRVTYAQLLSWNPEINAACSNLASLTSICITNPFGNYAMPSNDGGLTTVTTTAPVPAPTAPESNARCGEWHFVVADESCSTITEKFHIELDDFLFLNPQLWENCTNLWAETYYCVEPVGTITTYPGYLPTTSTEPFVPVSAVPLPWIPDLWENFTSTQPVIPLANNTRKDCYAYTWAGNNTETSVADCWKLAWYYGISAEEFILWNPSLDNGNITVTSSTTVIFDVTTVLTNYPYVYPCTLAESSSYCVELLPPMPTAAPNETAPSPRAAGETPDCTQWHKVTKYSTCDEILALFSVTSERFYAMNPSTGSDCTGLAVGTWYCVSTYPGGGPDPNETGYYDTTRAGSSTTSASSGVGISTPSPVQTGIVTNCNRFYKVVGGDTCYDIAQSYSVSLSDLYAWNPVLGTSCGGLQADVFICVGVEATATSNLPSGTTSATGIVTPTPTQEGMVSGCKVFYHVVLGDTCYDIAQGHSIALDTFYSWNPAVKTDCSGLQGGAYVCVGI